MITRTCITLGAVIVAAFMPALSVAADRTISAPATSMAQSLRNDGRLVTLDYDETSVVRLDGCLNFQTMIVFGKGEHIENVGLGDSSQWQVTPSKSAELLFVKPIAVGAYSNMTVVTDTHAYNFELKAAAEQACAHGAAIYELRFTYPATSSAALPSAATGRPVPTDLNALPLPEKRNTAYTYSGETLLVPLRVFDDGASTYMRWAEGTDTPAVYAVNADNTESIINYANRGDYLVIEQVARAFVLRRGNQKVTLYNDAYRVQGLDADSPKLRGKGSK